MSDWDQNKQSSSEDTSREEKVFFGRRRVDADEKQDRVHAVFDSVASKYDVMNDLMSLGIHRVWKKLFVHKINLQPGERCLDVAGGTGDIAFRLVAWQQALGEPSQSFRSSSKSSYSLIPSVVVCDLTEAMVQEGRRKDREGDILWVVGSAEELPFVSNSFDVYTISFGLRNVGRRVKALEEVYRILKPGGRFFCLEFSQVSQPLLSCVYDLYSYKVLPWLGQKVAQDSESYRYLADSIRTFPSPKALESELREVGFDRVRSSVFQSGLVAIHEARKPLKTR